MKDAIMMDPVGRLVLPKSVRERLQVDGPARFRSEVIGNKVELTLVQDPKAKAPPLHKKRGLLVVACGGKPVDVVEAIRKTREDHDEDILRHLGAGRRHAR